MKTERFEVDGNTMVIHLKEDLDHHNAVYIREMADCYVDKYPIKRIIFDFSGIIIHSMLVPCVPSRRFFNEKSRCVISFACNADSSPVFLRRRYGRYGFHYSHVSFHPSVGS